MTGNLLLFYIVQYYSIHVSQYLKWCQYQAWSLYPLSVQNKPGSVTSNAMTPAPNVNIVFVLSEVFTHDINIFIILFRNGKCIDNR